MARMSIGWGGPTIRAKQESTPAIPTAWPLTCNFIERFASGFKMSMALLLAFLFVGCDPLIDIAVFNSSGISVESASVVCPTASFSFEELPHSQDAGARVLRAMGCMPMNCVLQGKPSEPAAPLTTCIYRTRMCPKETCNRFEIR
jgi:hypothetical protein